MKDSQRKAMFAKFKNGAKVHVFGEYASNKATVNWGRSPQEFNTHQKMFSSKGKAVMFASKKMLQLKAKSIGYGED